MGNNPVDPTSGSCSRPGRARPRRAVAARVLAVSTVVVGVCATGFLLSVAAAPRSLAQEDAGDEPAARSNETCLNCHDRKGLEFVLPSGELVDAAVDGPAFDASLHGRAGTSCVDCHTTISSYPHPAPGVATLRELTINLNQSCTDCHEEAAGWEALHDTLDLPAVDSPVCTDCHGAHDVVRPADDPSAMFSACSTCHAEISTGYDDSVHASALRRGNAASATCVSCHVEDGIHEAGASNAPSCTTCHIDVGATYDESAHGMASAAGEDAAATCGDCHGSAHEMRSASDANATTYPLNMPETCGACHGDPELTARLGLDNVYEQYVDSIHGRSLEDHGLVVAANCSTCHTSHGIQPPDDPTSTVYPLHVPETCGTCHVGILEEYSKSVHGTRLGEGDLTAAICTDCHTAHTITESDAPQWQLDVIEECGTCHEESFDTFRDTFHGQASDLGFTRAARCSDCHGSHDILQIEDPGSSVALDNRVEMCRQCHPDANRNFVGYLPHADHGDREDYPTLYYAARLMNGLIIGVFVFFGIHTLLWFSRSSLDQLSTRRIRQGRGPLRLPRLLKRRPPSPRSPSAGDVGAPDRDQESTPGPIEPPEPDGEAESHDD